MVGATTGLQEHVERCGAFPLPHTGQIHPGIPIGTGALGKGVSVIVGIFTVSSSGVAAFF